MKLLGIIQVIFHSIPGTVFIASALFSRPRRQIIYFRLSGSLHYDCIFHCSGRNLHKAYSNFISLSRLSEIPPMADDPVEKLWSLGVTSFRCNAASFKNMTFASYDCYCSFLIVQFKCQSKIERFSIKNNQFFYT